ncbi:heterokaryon incompatibility protein-domain-containing protein [Cercophora scortea]|uniref:Heterokaryon incompatibility protein-domain-containing protein n=1 Tax=Cercophora scortea TaxID=314031 RepID=A0AAE0IDW7_9PEZI|nr:heterokaryon incompatibility protein-domain-containing protein [Cercophora scortea]
MKIYLVRVCDRPDGSLYIEYKPDATTDDDYIAISHVWGTPETVKEFTVDGVKWDVSLSPGKRDILTLLQRDDICGDNWFWMDLFCIDQTDSPTISIAEQLMAIPLVYKSSRCVKVLVESPVCQLWQDKVMQAFETRPIDPDALQEEELAHGRSCSHLLITDPWFERLWTRQEGLYANVLRFVVLQPVPCARLEIGPVKDRQGPVKGWIAHGTLLEKRFLVEEFLRDKLAYHGKKEQSRDASAAEAALLFSLYVDVVYRHCANFALVYECEPGPDSKYNPIMAAWRSRRCTTKPCDYILAVFPDIAGYKVPAKGARKMSFPELLRDAMTQPAVSANFQLATKVPRGLNGPTLKATESALPWLAEEPSNIGEAYDTFTVDDRTGGDSSTQNPSTGRNRAGLVPGDILNLQEIDATPSGLDSLKEDWKGFVNMSQHVALVSPSGPCTGLARRNIITNNSTAAAGPLLRQYFTQEFMTIAVSEYLLPQGGMEALSLRTEGVLSFDRLLAREGGVPEEAFARELKRFLFCLICGTSLLTADRVLEVADVVPGKAGSHVQFRVAC